MAEKGWVARPATKWDDVSDEAPPPLPPGVYGFKVASAEPHETKPKDGEEHGDNAVKVELAITHRYGDSPGSLKRKCFCTLMLVGDGTFRTKQLIRCLGVDPPEDNELDTIESWCDTITGMVGNAQFKQREYVPKGSAEKRLTLDVERFLTDETLEAALAAVSGESAPAADAPAPRRKRRAV